MSNNFAPFYVGQKVICVNALPGARVKNGQIYTISHVRYAPSGNPISPPGAKYWYVGIDDDKGAYITPKLFRPIDELRASIMSFSEIVKIEDFEILINN